VLYVHSLDENEKHSYLIIFRIDNHSFLRIVEKKKPKKYTKIKRKQKVK